MFPLLIFSLSLPPYIFPPSPSFFPFSLLSWTCKTLASASGMLVFQPCATIPTSEVWLSCPLCPKTVHWVVSLSLYHCSKKKKSMYVHTCIHMCMCVCLYGYAVCVYTMIGGSNGSTGLCLCQHCSLSFMLLYTSAVLRVQFTICKWRSYLTFLSGQLEGFKSGEHILLLILAWQSELLFERVVSS